MKTYKYCFLIILISLILGYSTASAQQDLAQQAYLIFQQNCLGCHGPHGPFTEQLVIESAPALIATGAVVPGDPNSSEFYRRLVEDTPEKPQMPWNLPPLTPAALDTVRQWIQVGAPDWTVQPDINFIATDAMLTMMQAHLATLDAFDRPSARYFTITHLYNAGETPETLSAYHIALSKTRQ